MRKCFVLLFIFMLPLEILSAEITLKSELRSDNQFLNRLRINGEFSRLSIISSGFEWVEPVFVSPIISVGRINLKGAVRELYNPDGLSAGSGVLFENSGVSVSDSMSRSSRYGTVLSLPLEDFCPVRNLFGWVFRENSGRISGGIMADSIKLAELPACAEADLLLNIGVCPENDASGAWMDEQPLMPQQLCLNAAAGLRAGLGLPSSCTSASVSGSGPGAGRIMLKPSSDDFSMAADLTAQCSLPQYTPHGGLFRCLLYAGSKTLYAGGIFQAADRNFITVSGELPANLIIWGIDFKFDDNIGSVEIESGAGYSYKQQRPQVIAQRLLAQEENVNIDFGITYKHVSLKINGDYMMNNTSNGFYSDEIIIDTGLKIDLDIITFRISGGLETDSTEYEVLRRDYNWGAEVSHKNDHFDVNVKFDYDSNVSGIKSTFKYKAEYAVIYASAAFNNWLFDGFSIGFSTE